jgi:hypothetical protein
MRSNGTQEHSQGLSEAMPWVSAPIEINSEPDHAHLLFTMSRTETVSNIVGQLKKGSNDWLRSRDKKFQNFYWQGGYGIFFGKPIRHRGGSRIYSGSA